MGPKNVESRTYKLSAEEAKFYEDNGYLVIKGLIGASTLDNLRKRFLQVIKKEVPRGRIAIIEDTEFKKKSNDPEFYVNKINQVSYDEVFMEYTEHPRLMDILSQLIGDDKAILNSMLINKPPGTPWHPVHQDGYHIPFQPSERILTTWTAIDAADETNGCLFVVPGSHKQKKTYEQELMPGFINSLFFVLKDADELAPLDKRVSLVVQPGDTVIMNSLMVHGSWPNSSERYRKAITCIYGSKCEFFDVSGTIQEPFMTEFYKELKNRGFEGTYKEFWESRRKEIKNEADKSVRSY